MNKPTAVTLHRTSEGERLAVLYSTIDGQGNITATNQQKSRIVLEEELLAHIAALETFVEGWLNQ